VIAQGVIHGDEEALLDPALCQQKAVEGIASHGFRRHLGHHVVMRDRQDGEACGFENTARFAGGIPASSLPSRALIAISQRLTALKATSCSVRARPVAITG
jgi:hypothetical protein